METSTIQAMTITATTTQSSRVASVRLKTRLRTSLVIPPDARSDTFGTRP
jgi:hypothetical protein